MVGAHSGVIWSYNKSDVVLTFDMNNPLTVSTSQCNDLTFCLWYVSPLRSLNDSLGIHYALLGELNKWTAVSQQRYTSIVSDAKHNQAVITIEGVSSEMISVAVFHSKLHSVTVNCHITASSREAQIVITPTNVTCY